MPGGFEKFPAVCVSIISTPSGKRVGIYGDMGATPAIGAVMPGGTTRGVSGDTGANFIRGGI